MNCNIQWNTYTHVQWDVLLKKCPHCTLLQSYYYAQATREVKQQGVRQGVIYIDGVEAGIIQAQEVSLLFKIIHMISIDRGPLWFKGFGTAEHLNAVAEQLNKAFPKRIGRKRRFIFEYYHKDRHLVMSELKINQDIGVYKTFLVSISPELGFLRKNLNKKWRNILNKSEKQNLSIQISENLSTLDVLLRNYVHDKAVKHYAGASPKFLASLAKYATRNKECLILNATEDDEIIASIMVFIHGNGATYQVGWTTPYGREKGAHHLLLWEAIRILKGRGITEFDLGGHNDETEGLYRFKHGMGGQEITLIGSYS